MAIKNVACRFAQHNVQSELATKFYHRSRMRHIGSAALLRHCNFFAN